MFPQKLQPPHTFKRVDLCKEKYEFKTDERECLLQINAELIHRPSLCDFFCPHQRHINETHATNTLNELKKKNCLYMLYKCKCGRGVPYSKCQISHDG